MIKSYHIAAGCSVLHINTSQQGNAPSVSGWTLVWDVSTQIQSIPPGILFAAFFKNVSDRKVQYSICQMLV